MQKSDAMNENDNKRPTATNAALQVLTRRDVNTGDRHSTPDHRLDDGRHVWLGRRTAEPASEQRVDDDVVRAGDEVRLGRHVRQERDVLQLALLGQLAVERRLARPARVEDGRTIVLSPQSTTNQQSLNATP